MPVYLFTFHAYRTWNADHPRGYVQRKPGIKPSNPSLARYYDAHASQTPMRFLRSQQEVLVWITLDACMRREWQLHYIATDSTHVHLLVSWQTGCTWREVGKKLKNLASLMLSRKCGSEGRKWFVRKGSRKRVRNQQHFDYLVTRYLPRHRGLRWGEGDPPPKEP